MEEQFVSYELAVKLKELGFDEECFAYYLPTDTRLIIDYSFQVYEKGFGILAPLWQQAFDWFREKYNLESSVYWSNNYKDYRFSVDNLTKIPNEGDLISMESKTFNTYEEARQACLEKLIELCQK